MQPSRPLARFHGLKKVRRGNSRQRIAEMPKVVVDGPTSKRRCIQVSLSPKCTSYRSKSPGRTPYDTKTRIREHKENRTLGCERSAMKRKKLHTRQPPPQSAEQRPEPSAS